jgi:hypothetical protein
MAERWRNYDRDYARNERDFTGRDWMTNQHRYGNRGQEDDRYRGSNYSRGNEYGGGYNNEFGSGFSRDYSERGFGGNYDRNRDNERGQGYWGQGDRPFESGRTSNFSDYDRNRSFGSSEYDRNRSFGMGDYDRDRSRYDYGRDYDEGRTQFNRSPQSWSSNWDRDRDYGSSYSGSTGSEYRNFGNRGQYGSGRAGSQGSYGSTGRDFGSNYGSVYRGGDYDNYGDFDRSSRSYGNNAYGFDRDRGDREESWGDSIKNFFGIGPKGYKRSDEKIKDDVNERLEDHPRIDASNIEVQVNDGEVTLSGNVNDRYSKRLAEDVAGQSRGVKDVHNQIRVQSQSTMGTIGGTGTSLTGSTATTTSTTGTTGTSTKKDRAA